MAQWNRQDICEAHLAFENDWHSGGWLQERPSNQRRQEATHMQLARMRFRARPNLNFRTLSDNGKDIYRDLALRYGLFEDPVDEMMAVASERARERGGS